MVGHEAEIAACSRYAATASVEQIHSAMGLSQAWKITEQHTPDLVVLFESISPIEGLQFVKKAQARLPQTQVVVIAGEPSVDWAVQFVRAGAYDYIAGPFADDILTRLLVGMSRQQASPEEDPGRFFCEECPPGMPIVGRSRGMEKCLSTIRMVAQSRCNPILILGETGTGKELAARAVHCWRYADHEKFVAVNCATLTANLLESELFGHVKGAFTGADRDKTGLFELAEGGSIFLDEISEIPPEL